MKIEENQHFKFIDALLSHKEPICPRCREGRIVCPSGKIDKPHFFECANQCGWYVNIDYDDIHID